MDLATILSVVQTILTAIHTLDKLKAMFSFSDFERELVDLQNTVNYVKSVLEDAETKQDALNNQEIFYIEELKDAVYDADDVLDEFVFLVKRKQLTKVSDKFAEKVSSFLSRFKILTRSMSHKVKEVNKKLDVVASKSSKFCFKVERNPVKFVKEESSSFIAENHPVFGRGEDLEKIVEMLLSTSDVHQPNYVSSLAIVGMGGLGKTTLAQLAYNDPRITSAFPHKSWTCIADHDKWSLKHLLGKIIGQNHDLTSLEQMHHEIRKQLEGKKYLLVLDDVWTESCIEWQELEKYLMVGKSGSRIVVTTRSKKTAQIIGGVRVHELQGLSKHESWRLFKRTAFGPGENPDEAFVKLGKDIVTQCFNIPLAIKVVGSLLHGETMVKWLSFRDKELSNISENDDTMTKILSLSYYKLNTSLKSCFAYCAIFPKHFRIHKQMLLNLWMAQGYINSECEGEQYLYILLQRLFFQDVEEDTTRGECFKIHDLLHDVAEQVASKDVCRLVSDPFSVDRKVRHLSLLNGICPQEIFNKPHIRTCLQFEDNSWYLRKSDQLLAGNLIANCSSLRSLDLSCLHAQRLPESIGKLFHLRYLNLAYSSNLKVLPNSITKLVNLQTLDLFDCTRLEQLPKDMCKLVDLSTLNITDCVWLSHMPSKLDSLINLHTLGLFVVGGESSYEQHSFSGLEVLLDLNNLKGSLHIRINTCKDANYVKEDHGGGAYLLNKVHLHKIYINVTNGADESIKSEQALLEEMQPHANIKVLILEGYSGETMPRWPRKEDNSMLFYFDNLVSLSIFFCRHLRFLPSLEKLPHLKKLKLWGLRNVEYMVNVNLESRSLIEGTTFFPCLETLNISRLPKLKGWWPRSRDHNEHPIGEPFPGFAQLKELRINECPTLKSIPICSHLNMVRITDCDPPLRIDDMDQLPPDYKCFLPSESKSRMITISYLETILAK